MKNKKTQFNFQKFLHSKYGSFVAIILNLSIIFGIGFIYTNQTEQIEAQETLSKIGSRGDEVRRIQNKLKSLGNHPATNALNIFSTVVFPPPGIKEIKSMSYKSSIIP